MNASSTILGILPLIVFVILDSFLGPKKALISAILLAFAEAIYTIITFGELDIVTGASVFLLLSMGGLSLIKKETIYFKFQPVIFSVLFGIFMLYSYFAETNFFLVAIEKYKSFIPVDKHFVWKIPEVRQALINLPLVFGFGLFIHAIVTAIAAIKLSNWWWILCRAVGFYFIFFVSWVISFKV